MNSEEKKINLYMSLVDSLHLNGAINDEEEKIFNDIQEILLKYTNQKSS